MSLENLYEETLGETVSEANLQAVSQLAQQAEQRAAEIKNVESMLKELKAQQDKLLKTDLPEAMVELNLAELTLASGHKVAVKPFYSINFTKKEDKSEALDWLEANGHGDIIKCTVVVQMERDKIEEAMELARLIEAEGYSSKVDRGVHYQTLLKWFKENEETIIPDSLFTTFIGTEAKIK